MITRELRRWIKEIESKPLDKNYQKALNDVKNKIDELEERATKYYGEMELQITDIGNLGTSSFRGYVQNAYENMVQHIDMKLRHPRRVEVTKFLVEVKMTKFDIWEK